MGREGYVGVMFSRNGDPFFRNGDSSRAGMLPRIAAVCFDLLIIFVALWALTIVVQHLNVVFIPLAVAILLAALVSPLVEQLRRHGVPRALATALSVLLGLAFVGGLVTFVAYTLSNGFSELQRTLEESLRRIHGWLVHGPLSISEAQFDSMLQQAQNWLTQHREQVIAGVFGALNTAASLLVGSALAIFILIFLLYDGRKIWQFLLIPWREDVRRVVDLAGHRVFAVLTTYIRVTVLVAFIDAVGIGVGLLLVRVPLALPLAVLVFLGAFVPIVGAFASGLVAVLVTLATNGLTAALIVLGIVLFVQQLEGNVLHPFLTAGLIRLHPLAVVLSVTVGTTLAGVIGALLAVPVVASVRAVVRTVMDSRKPAEVPASPDSSCEE